VAGLADDLTALAVMSPVQLRAEWRRVYRAVPPPLTPDLLARGIAYRLQEKVYGGVPPKVIRAIRRLAEQALRNAADPVARVQVKPGTRLVRSWQGTTYSVLVTDDGFLLGEQTFGSLSHVASAITGAHWSGPRFFGVKAARATTGAAARSETRRAHGTAQITSSSGSRPAAVSTS
jgi:hypothetical protein